MLTAARTNEFSRRLSSEDVLHAGGGDGSPRAQTTSEEFQFDAIQDDSLERNAISVVSACIHHHIQRRSAVHSVGFSYPPVSLDDSAARSKTMVSSL